MLGKNLTLTIVIVASLAIGIGAHATIFSVVDALYCVRCLTRMRTA